MVAIGRDKERKRKVRLLWCGNHPSQLDSIFSYVEGGSFANTIDYCDYARDFARTIFDRGTFDAIFFNLDPSEIAECLEVLGDQSSPPPLIIAPAYVVAYLNNVQVQKFKIVPYFFFHPEEAIAALPKFLIDELQHKARGR